MISKEAFLAIYYTSFYCNILCLLTGLSLVKFQKRRDTLILVYLLFSIFFDFLGERVIDWFNVDTNYHMHNIWSFVEFIIVWIFYFHIDDIKKIKILHWISLAAFLALCTIILLYYQSIYEIIKVHKLYSAIYFSAISVYIYYQFLNKLDTHLLRKSIFWQNTAFFIYFTGNILLFLMVDQLFTGDIDIAIMNAWAIHNSLTIIKAIGLVIAFIINYKFYVENRS